MTIKVMSGEVKVPHLQFHNHAFRLLLFFVASLLFPLTLCKGGGGFRFVKGLKNQRPSLSTLNKISFERQPPVEILGFQHIVPVENVELETEFLVEGTMTGRFNIDLDCESGSRCAPLHISIRPAEQAFVYNALFPSGIFDLEERRFFFLENNTFIRISIVIHPLFFEITVNDYCTKLFEHRMDFQKITQFRITDSIDLALAEVYYPEELDDTEYTTNKKF